MDRESSVWSFFTKKADCVATCNTCGQDYSFRASTSNLRKHWYNKHKKFIEDKPSDLSEHTSDHSDADEEQQAKAVATLIVNKTKSMAIWQYFDPLDLDKCEATCKICNKNLSYEYMSDLKQHIQDHGHDPKDSDDEYVPDVEEKKLKRRQFKSKLWDFFRATDDKMAECLMCHNMFNFGSTITNLRRHLMRKHAEAALLSNDSEPNNIIKYDGQLYEVMNGHGQEDDDEEPKEMDVVYLNEEELDDDSMDKPPTPKKEQLIIPRKRKLSTKVESKRNSIKVTKEQVRSTRDTCSEELELPRKPIPTPTYTSNSMGSVDFFGQYVVSLLKELPKAVSDQLQSEIIKQILTSKMAIESQTVVAKYDIVRSRTNEEDTNVPEPISYTVVQSNETADKLTENTESIVK